MTFCSLLSLTGHAQLRDEKTEGSGIDADYICHQEGGGVAFKVKGPTEEARVWQIDEVDGTGLEFNVTRFSVLRCLGCYSFEANYAIDEVGSVNVRGKVNNYELTYELYDSDENKWVTLLDKVKCKKANRTGAL